MEIKSLVPSLTLVKSLDLAHKDCTSEPSFLYCITGIVILASQDCKDSVRSSMPKNPPQLLILRRSSINVTSISCDIQLFLYYKASGKYVFI